MIIENFKIKEFLKQDKELIERYIVALQYLKPVKTERTIFHLKLRQVEFIKNSLFSNSDEALIK